MAEYALPPGAVRRRAVFGLLDADGWAWATIKATFWFVFIIFVLGLRPGPRLLLHGLAHDRPGLQRHLADQHVPGDGNADAALPGACRRGHPVAVEPD